jgi:hypothetical protein
VQRPQPVRPPCHVEQSLRIVPALAYLIQFNTPHRLRRSDDEWFDEVRTTRRDEIQNNITKQTHRPISSESASSLDYTCPVQSECTPSFWNLVLLVR